MENEQVHALLTKWNRLYDAVVKFDEYFSSILEEEEELFEDFDDDEESVE